MGTRVLQNAFTGGEIAPQLLGRVDDGGYQTGAAKLENFIVLPQGAIRSRAGFAYVATAKDSTTAIRLVPFRFSSTQTLVLILGDQYMRVATQGQILYQNGAPYEISTPYYAEDLNTLDFSQNADILTVTSPYYPPKEIRRYGAYDWRIVDVSTSATLSAPVISSVTAVNANYMSDSEKKDANKITATYVVTAVDENNRESAASSSKSGTGNYYITGCSIKVTWSAVAGAVKYKVYRQVSGVFGYIGETDGTTLNDTGSNPDMSETPPKYVTAFESDVGYVSSIDILTAGSGYYQQLTATYPDVVFGNGSDTVSSNISVSGGLSSRTYALSVTATDCSVVISDTTYTSYSATLSISDIHSLLANMSVVIGSADGTVAITVGSISFTITAKVSASETVTSQTETASDTGTFTLPLSFSDSSGSGASARATIDMATGSVTAVTVTAAGSNYLSPHVELESSTGTGATFRVNVTSDSGTTLNYPSANSQFDQRRIFAGTLANPLKCWFTNAGVQDCMAYHSPLQDDDRIEITAVTSDADRIKHAVSLESLILFTGSSELRVYTQNSDALTPTSVAVRALSYVGSNEVQPIVSNSRIIFAGSRGGHVYGMGYDNNVGGYSTQDMSIRSVHLFDDLEIVDMALCKSPVNIIWCVTSGGDLLGCTFYPEQNVMAWHKQVTDGTFESICCVAEGLEDRLYAVVNRNGIKFIERLDTINPPDDETNYRYLDCYKDAVFSSATRTISGLDYLEGREVAVYVDGVQQTNKTVQNGSVTLDSAGYNVAVGLPYTATLITVPLTAKAEAYTQGRVKNIAELFLRIQFDGDLFGNNYSSETLWKVKQDDIYMIPQAYGSKLVKVTFDGDWNEQGQLHVEHRDARPVEIASIISNIAAEQ